MGEAAGPQGLRKKVPQKAKRSQYRAWNQQLNLEDEPKTKPISPLFLGYPPETNPNEPNKSFGFGVPFENEPNLVNRRIDRFKASI